MLKTLQLLEFRQVSGKPTITWSFVSIAFPTDAIVPTGQGNEVVPDVCEYFQVALNMTIAFVVLYLVFVGAHCLSIALLPIRLGCGRDLSKRRGSYSLPAMHSLL